MKLRYGFLKEGAEGLKIRAKPGGKIIGVLRPGVKFYLTGEEVTHKIAWVEGVAYEKSSTTGWVARSQITIHETEPQAPGPVNVPRDVEIPARYDRKLFRNWKEAIWQIGPIVALAALFWWWFF